MKNLVKNISRILKNWRIALMVLAGVCAGGGNVWGEAYTYNGTWTPSEPVFDSYSLNSGDTIKISSNLENYMPTPPVDTLVIPSGVVLTVDSGVTFSISNRNLQINGSAVISGTLSTSQSLVITGTVTNKAGATITSGSSSSNSGTFINKGTFNVTATGFTNTGNITNTGSLIINNGLTNSGTITNSGALSVSDADFKNESTGTVSNSGTINTNSTITNDGGNFNSESGIISGAQSVSGVTGTSDRNYIFIGPGSDWDTAGNWKDSDKANVTCSNNKSAKISLQNDCAVSGDFTINNSGTGQITILLNGHNFSIGGILIMSSKGTHILELGTYDSNIKFIGPGEVTINSIDTCATHNCTIDFENNVTCTVTDSISADLDSSHNLTISGDSSCTFYAPASGSKVDYGESRLVYNPKTLPKPYGEPKDYSVTSTRTLPARITFNKKTNDLSSSPVTFKYSIQTINEDAINDEVWTFNGATVSNGSKGSVELSGNQTSKGVELSLTGTCDAGDGIIITIYTPDGTMNLAEIRFIQDEIIWTGASGNAWDTVDNWSGISTISDLANAIVTIPAGCTNYPETGSIEIGTLNIANNARAKVSSGTLTVNKIITEGTGKLDASAGTVIFKGNDASWKSSYPEYSSFGTLQVASGATLTPESDIYITTAFDNASGGTYDAITNSITTYLRPAASGTVTISGNSADKIDTLDATNLGLEQEVSFNGDISIKTLMLSGKENHLLKVTGTGTISLPTNQTSGKYLDLSTGSIPTIASLRTYSIFDSTFPAIKTDATDKGWLEGDPDSYIWQGNSTSWSNPSNWSSGIVPAIGSDVLIPSGCTLYPKLIAADTVSTASITVESGASLDFNGQSISTSTSFTMNGTIILNGSEDFSGIIGATFDSRYILEYDSATATYSTATTGFLTTPPAEIIIDENAILTLAEDLSFGKITNDGKIVINEGKTLELTESGTNIYSGDGEIEVGGGTLKNSISTEITLTNITLSTTTDSTVDGGSAGIVLSTAFTSGKLITKGKVSLKGELTSLNISEGTTTLSDTLTISDINITSEATLNANNQNITVSNKWNRAGTFNPGTNTVSFTGGTIEDDTTFYSVKITGNVSITGSNIFENLTIESDKTVTFTAGKETKVTNNLSLENVTLTSNNEWTLTVPGTSTFKSVTVKNCKATNSLTAIENSTDEGGNVNWNFKGEEYKWTGTSSTTWTTASNWTPASVPGNGTIITVPASCTNYPVLEEATTIDTGTLTIEENASFDLGGFEFTCDKLILNGTVKIKQDELFSTTSTNTFGDNYILDYYDAGEFDNNAKNFFQNPNIKVESGKTLSVTTTEPTTFTSLTNAGTVNLGSKLTVGSLENKSLINVNAQELYITTSYTKDSATTPQDSITTSGGKIVYSGSEATFSSITLDGATFENTANQATITKLILTSNESTINGTKNIIISDILDTTTPATWKLKTQNTVSLKGTFASLTVDSGSTTTLSDLSTITSLENNGTLNVNAETTVDSLTNTGTVNLGAKLTVDSLTNSSTVKINGKQLEIKNSYTPDTNTSPADTLILTDGGQFTYSSTTSSITVSNAEITGNVKIDGGNGLTLSSVTYNTSPSITTTGTVSIPGGTVSNLTVSSGKTSVTTELISDSLSLTGELSLGSTLTVKNVTFAANTGVLTANNNNITVSGSWDNAPNGTFTPGTGTSGETITQSLTFTGAASSPATTTVKGTTTFYDATFNAPVTIEADNTFHDATFNSSVTLKEANTFNNATFKNAVAFDNSNTFANLTFTEDASGEITTKQTVSGLLKITTASTKTLSLSATDNDFANPVQIGTYDATDPANPTHTETGTITLGGANLQIAANAYAKELTLVTAATLNGNVTTTNSQEYKAITIPPSTEIKLTTTATATNTINFGGDVSGGSKLTINAPAVISDDVKFTTPQIVFEKTLDDTTAGAHSLTLDQTGTAVEVTFNGKIGATTPLKSLICYGTTNINTESVTTSEVQQYAILNIQQSTTLSAPGTAASGITFTGNVTGKDANTELTIKNANSTWGTSTPKIDVTNFKDLIFINDSANDYSLNATYANMISNSIPVYFYGNETTAAAGKIDFTPGSTVYAEIYVEKHANLNFTGDFKQTDNNSTEIPTFLIKGANVTLGTTAFIVDYLKVQEGGHFTQTGNNGNDSNNASTKKHSVYKMENSVENGIIWNKDNTDPDEGGSLIIKYGTVENTDTPIQYFLKKIDLWANTITLKGTFWNLIIPSGVEVHNSDYICVRNNFTIENTGKYIHEEKPLTLGTNLSDSGLNSASDETTNGNFIDKNPTANNLGNVTINAPGITKRTDTNSNFLCTNLTITSDSIFTPDSDWNVEISGNFTDNGTLTLGTDKKLIFNGETPSEILPNKGKTYPYIEINKSDSTDSIPNVTIKADIDHDELKVSDITVSIPTNADFTVEGKLSNTNSTITNCQKSEFKNTVNCTNFKISNWSSLIFDESTAITDFETPGSGNSGSITFQANTNITNDTTFNTTGTVTFGDSTTDDDFTFGASIIHTAGPTILKGDLTAQNTINFADTTIDGTLTSQNSSITCGNTTINGSVKAKTAITLGNTNVTGSIESQDSSITLADTTLNGSITANDSITLANTTVSGTITSTASSIETNKLTLTGDSSVIAKTDITINDSISGRDYNLTLDSPAQITLTSSDTNKLTLTDSSTPAVPTSSIVINGGEIKTQEMLKIPFNTTVTAATTLSVTDDGTGSLFFPSTITIDLQNSSLTINAYTQLHGKFTSSTNSPDASITINNDAIINNTGNTTEINVPLTCQNLVVYNGELKTSANITTTKDLLFYGTNYNETDQCSNIDKIYTYTNRFANTQFEKTKLPDNLTEISSLFTTPSSFTGTLTTVGELTINSAHNFYANGLTATGDSDWNLKLKSNRNTIQNFADAFYCDFTASPCIVSCNNSTNVGDLCIAAEACTVKTGYENNWDLDDFEISHAYTVHDNLIIIQFNRNLRFIDNELADTSKVQRIKYFNGTSESSYQVVITNDNLAAPAPLEASMNPSDSIYLCACTTSTALSTGIWNSDASGIFAGYPASKDTHKIHQNAIPYLNIPRNAYNSDGTTVDYAFFITDEYGKRLLHYFNTTPATTEKSENGETYTNVKDRSCPVLTGIKIGQEQYSDYDDTVGESSQHSYDSHNFIEFTYSESVNFGSQDPAVCDIWIPAYDATQNNYVVENVRVSEKLGALIGDITKEGKLVFTGLGSIANGKIHTGKNGTTDATVNAFYRDNPFSIRLSIAGWTDGTIIDRDGNDFKNWAGYIESAVMPSGNYALELTSSLVTDLYGNTQKSSVETITVDNTDDGTYGLWDLSEPVFAPCRLSISTDWGNKTQSEAVGAGSGSTLDRIEFHLFDNSPLYDATDSAFWFTQKGWCKSISSTTLKDVDYTYCADIIGGSRPYEPTARRTKGGIRFSTKANNPQAFKYSTTKSANPDSSFINSITGVYSTTTSTIFTGSSSPRRSNTDPDGLYLGLGLPETNLPVETTFTVSYDDSTGFLTDLAGNRLRSDTINTIDRTPPSIDLCLSELNKDELLVIFVKELNTDSSALKFVDQTGTPIPITHSFEQILPYCFEIVQLDANGTPTASSDLKIDTSKAAKVEIRNPAADSPSKSTFTFITLKLNRTLTLKDLQTLHIRLRNAPQYPEKTRDPITSIDNSRVTFIQDTIGNYTSMYTAHSLSDFIIGGITPLYAYDADMTYNSESIMDGFYEEGSWAVHDWEAEQQNYGKLPANHPISLVVSLDDGTAQKDNLPSNARVYLANSPDAASIATQFNADFNHKLRVWLPDVTNGLFPGFALSNNTNYAQTDSELLTDNLKDGLIFNISKDITTKWNNNDQISFLFGLLNPDKTPMRIYNAPYFNVTTNTYDFSRSTAVPLYSMRLHDPTDILSLELWSFRVRSITEQRAGVTILNNVINSDKGEKTVVKVNMPSEGKLSVMVMTLDGNIVQYLTHGDASAGEHYYSWNGKNKNGKAVARGMYFIRIVGNGIDETRKVMVVK